jgi:hypothetical protein
MIIIIFKKRHERKTSNTRSCPEKRKLELKIGHFMDIL